MDTTAIDTPSRERLYLIDVSTCGNTLQKVIEKENMKNTIIYCFSGAHAPKISLAVLDQYSAWLQEKRLFIIGPPPTTSSAPSTEIGDTTTPSLAFWAGKLVSTFAPENTKIFISSEDFSLYSVVLWLRDGGFEVESSWPEPESVQCNDDILYTVITQIQRLHMEPPKDTESFIQFLRKNCRLPNYISSKSVLKTMQSKGMITFHKGVINYHAPVLLDTIEDAPPSSRRRERK